MYHRVGSACEKADPEHRLKIGPSTDPMADYGPLVTKAHLDKVKAYVDLGMQRRRKDSCRRSRFQDARLLERLLHGRVPV
jgi:acyl-CoA reductase-like NAD-dependent aldehyde dehydrogenase